MHEIFIRCLAILAVAINSVLMLPCACCVAGFHGVMPLEGQSASAEKSCCAHQQQDEEQAGCCGQSCCGTSEDAQAGNTSGHSAGGCDPLNSSERCCCVDDVDVIVSVDATSPDEQLAYALNQFSLDVPVMVERLPSLAGLGESAERSIITAESPRALLTRKCVWRN